MAEASLKQHEILRYTAREDPILTILEGAVRSGKTVSNVLLWFSHMASMKGENRHFIMTGYTIGSLKKNVLDVMEEMFGIPIHLSLSNEFNYLGNKICCFGSNKSDSFKTMRGLTSYGWYANEITLSHPNTIDEAFKRCSGDGSRMFWDTNPDHPNHIVKTQYIDHSGERLATGKERIKSWHFQLRDNTFLSEEYIENLIKSTPPGVWYDRGILGQWVAAEGVVYPGFSRDKHVIDQFDIPVEWPRYVGIDWGFTNPLCVLWIAKSPDDILYVYDEHFMAGKLLEDHSEIILAREAQAVRRDEQDREMRPRYVFRVSDHDTQDAAEFAKLGIPTRPAKKGRGSVSLGIEKVARRFVFKENKKAGLYILRGKADNLVRELGSYVWATGSEKTNEPEEPVKKDDHTVDTLRYVVDELDNSSVPIIKTTRRVA